MQVALARAAATALVGQPWSSPPEPLIAGCFVAHARGEAGPGHPGDRAWGAAVLWRAPATPSQIRRPDAVLRGTVFGPAPRQAADVAAQAVVARTVPAAYAPGLLALREGPILAAAVNALPHRPDIVMVDATGTDHPRRAGLAVQLGAVLGLPSIGVTHRALAGHGAAPELRPRRHRPGPPGLAGSSPLGVYPLRGPAGARPRRVAHRHRPRRRPRAAQLHSGFPDPCATPGGPPGRPGSEGRGRG